MATNEQVVLTRVLEQGRSDIAPEFTESEYFGFFATEQVLKHADLSWDEIENGITDGGGDGGIDGIYIFVDGVLISEDADVPPVKNATIELEILQHKKQRSFSEGPLDALSSSLADLLNLDTDIDQLGATYNEAVISGMSNFRRVYLDLAPSFPSLVVRVRYVSQGADVHPNVQRKGEKLSEDCRLLFSDAEVDVQFVGAEALLELAQASAHGTHQLQVSETVSTENVGFACLVRLDSFNRLITLDDGTLRTAIFESNVRDYQGQVEVNSAIRETLQNPDDEDFWWLNNGVTIIVSKASLAGKTLTIENPQVVNGLQTSTEISKYFVDHDVKEDPRHVLVRVIIPGGDESRDRIIRATNSQTAIPQASLRATDPLQQRIETYFRTHDLYYDRRKNYYKNQGRPREKIVGIPYLAQSIMAVTLGEPDNARARPSSLLKRDEDYARVFGDGYEIDMYLNAARTMRLVDEHLIRKTEMRANERNNVKFHAGFVVARKKLGKLELTPADVAGLVPEEVTDDDIESALATVKEALGKLQEDGAASSEDQAAKSRKSVDALKSGLADGFKAPVA